MPRPDLSLIIPAYNEERRISRTLEAIESYAESLPIALEIIVVSDGSTDRTAEVVRTFIDSPREAVFRLDERPVNRGKGAAIKAGMALATGEIVGYTDADLPYGLDAVAQVTGLLSKNSPVDIVIGARDLPESRSNTRVPLARRIAGRVYAILVITILKTRVADTQCGFKFFRNGVARALFQKVTIAGFGFDAELIHMARINNLNIKRIPVVLERAEGSSVKLVRDSIRMLWETCAIRVRDIRRFYGFTAADCFSDAASSAGGIDEEIPWDRPRTGAAKQTPGAHE